MRDSPRRKALGGFLSFLLSNNNQPPHSRELQRMLGASNPIRQEFSCQISPELGMSASPGHAETRHSRYSDDPAGVSSVSISLPMSQSKRGFSSLVVKLPSIVKPLKGTHHEALHWILKHLRMRKLPHVVQLSRQ